MSRTTAWLAIGVLGAAAGVTLPAYAQSEDKAGAEVAFEAAKKLMAAGKFAEACPKFAASNRLDPGLGILLYLADCYEKNGQTATAWATFREAAGRAKRAGQADREEVATKRAAALEPKLAKITVVVPNEVDAPGLEVKRDGSVVDRALWGAEIPVDLGEHVVEVTAPGKTTWSTKAVAKAGTPVTVTVPALEAVGSGAPAQPPPSSPQPTPQPAAPSGLGAQKTAALGAAAAGGGGIAVGAVYGLSTFSTWAAAKKECPAGTGPTLHCSLKGQSLAATANDDATISTLAFTGGGIALAGAALLWITAPKAKPTTTTGLRAGPLVTASVRGLVVEGAF